MDEWYGIIKQPGSGSQERKDVPELLADEITLELSVANCTVEKCTDDRILRVDTTCEEVVCNPDQIYSTLTRSELYMTEKVGQVANFKKLFSIFEWDPAKRESFARSKLLGSITKKKKNKISKISNKKSLQSPSVKRKQNDNNILIDHVTKIKKQESLNLNTTPDSAEGGRD